MKFNTEPPLDSQIKEEKSILKPENYDQMEKCPYCGMVMCDSFSGGSMCGLPYITDIKLLSPKVIEIIKYEYGEDVVNSMIRSSELSANRDLRQFNINRLDKNEADVYIDKKREEAYRQLTNINDEDRTRFGAVTGLDIDTMLKPRERYYVSLLLKDKAIDKEKINKILDFDMNIFIITEYDHSITTELVDYLQDKIRARETKRLVRTALENFEVFGKIISNMLDKDPELKKEKAGDLAEFSQQVFEALVRKMKDLCLVIIRAKDEETHKKGEDALEGLSKSIAIIFNMLGKGSTYKRDVIEMPHGQMPQFLLTDYNEKEYKLKFLVRPKAEKKAQARINVEIDFDTEKPNNRLREVFYQETEWLNNPKRKGVQNESVFRMGFDLDVDNPLNPGLSLDIGRCAIESEKRITTGETLGNLLASVSPEATHTPYSFDKKFADPELFERLAREFEEYLLSIKS